MTKSELLEKLRKDLARSARLIEQIQAMEDAEHDDTDSILIVDIDPVKKQKYIAKRDAAKKRKTAKKSKGDVLNGRAGYFA